MLHFCFPGYRSVPLKNSYSEELELASLLVHIEIYNAKVGKDFTSVGFEAGSKATSSLQNKLNILTLPETSASLQTIVGLLQ